MGNENQALKHTNGYVVLETDPPTTVRPCNRPDIGPIEFLQAVMRDGAFAMSIRMQAAKHLALIEAQAPQPPSTIYLKDPWGDQYLKRFPCLKENMQ